MTAISVVIPAYNREETVRVAVESVLRQTHPDLEVIVVDDASTDDTVAAVGAIADQRLRLLPHQRNLGGAAARNTGIRAARHGWVAFQDSDDEWLPRKLELQLAAIARLGPETVGAYCGMIRPGPPREGRPDPRRLAYWPAPRRDVPLEGDLYRSLAVGGSLISTQTLVARRDALLAAGGFDEGLKALQDWDLVLRLSRLGPIAFEPEPLVIQRYSPNSLTRSIRNRADAREAIVARHLDEMATAPDRLAEYYHQIGSMRRQTGEHRAARAALVEALRRDPARLRAWAGLARALLAGLRPGRGGR